MYRITTQQYDLKKVLAEATKIIDMFKDVADENPHATQATTRHNNGVKLISLQSVSGENWQEINHFSGGDVTERIKFIKQMMWSKDNCVINKGIDPEGEIYRFISTNKLTRARLIALDPMECYYMHDDRHEYGRVTADAEERPFLRMHLPVITHKWCYHVEDYKLRHMPADGYPWVVNTSKIHSAMNATRPGWRIRRWHIVGDYLDRSRSVDNPDASVYSSIGDLP
jgi:hypothetical protein